MCKNANVVDRQVKKMTPSEYEHLQDRLRKKLKHCNGLTGKRREGFEEGIKTAMSILNSIKPNIQVVDK